MGNRRSYGSGLTKISIAFTKELIAKALGRFRSLIAMGHSQLSCVKAVDAEFPGLSKQMLDRLFDMASGKKIDDDFPEDQIETMKAVAEDTFELLLKRDRPDLVRGTIVHFMGADWYVRKIEGARLQIRRIA